MTIPKRDKNLIIGISICCIAILYLKYSGKGIKPAEASVNNDGKPNMIKAILKGVFPEGSTLKAGMQVDLLEIKTREGLVIGYKMTNNQPIAKENVELKA